MRTKSCPPGKDLLGYIPPNRFMSEVWNQLLEKQCYKNKATEGYKLADCTSHKSVRRGPGPWRGPVPAESRTAQLMGFLLGRSCPLQNNRDSPPPNFPHHSLFWKLRYCWQNLVMCGGFSISEGYQCFAEHLPCDPGCLESFSYWFIS